ncbi:ubiquinone biosynthesis regulatory protein kinase UbiB [Arenicella xantha]|uniref:2-octaprenylphenol hydroxylase n=1 Tax=Arenicella xantha TaxID=644221 RepID=A0A395JSV7_9GAMM|nr:ubiquinone biosynthesis regulatory protein kinase UbiB [Arenicella xantha]RBP53625.1 2-octaprenylphenol hydroxylase [Arenicella xantha]
MAKTPSRLSRIIQIRRVIKRHNLASLVDDMQLTGRSRWVGRALLGGTSPDSSESAEPRGRRIRLALEELGPVFVKLGQALSTRPDLLPQDIADELTLLQDQVPPFSADQSMRLIEQAYGDDYTKIFESVEPTPMASASVAQVHAARLRPGLAIAGQNGEKQSDVVIKVLRPGIQQVVESDLRVMHTVAGLLQTHWKRGKQFRPHDVIKEYDQTIHDELDLRVEAANGARMGADFETTDIIYVPRIYWDYTHQNVMVMERIHGTSIREFAQLEAKGFDLQQLAADGVEVFFTQAFEKNFFHADMHAGNIFVSDQGKWIAIDFGIMGTLDEHDKQYLAQMLLGFFNRDYRSIAQAHLRAGWIPADTRIEDFEQAVRMVCEPIFAKPLSEISFGNVLLQLFQTVRRFEMPVQPQLVLLYKTILNIEGLGRQLYPELNLWDTAKPFLEKWMKDQLSPKALLDDFKRDWPIWKALLPELPNYLHQQLNPIQAPKPAARPLPVGLITASLAGIALLAEQLGWLHSPQVTETAPWLIIAGLLLVWLRR